MRGRVVEPRVGALSPLHSLVARRWRPQWICQGCRRRSPSRRTSATSTTAASTAEKPWYVTTPIFYVNASPHVGHMYSMILADVLKRWQLLKGRNAILRTGTDEHGMKIQQAAAKARLDPRAFCDKGAEVFKDLAARIDVSNDGFTRTTHPAHVEAVEYAWQMLADRGYVYESRHEGWYSVSDETFYPDGQVHLMVEPSTGRKIKVSTETGKEVEWSSERNYHFRLSAFSDRLLDFYRANPDFIVPRSRMNEVVQQVTAGLEDLSISRPVDRLTWGIRVPTDSTQTIYVWLDALLNYATAAGYPFTPGRESEGGWPADVHVVGKDIVRFHCIYWPAFLMALDLPLPRQVLAHAHWTLGRKKMAKSTGNVVDPFFALERFGVDTMRWFLIHNGGIADDADYDNSFIVEKYQLALQKRLGNLVLRVVKGTRWSVREAVEANADPNLSRRIDSPAAVREIIGESDKDRFELHMLPFRVEEHMLRLHPGHALRTIMEGVYHANTHMQDSAPWALRNPPFSPETKPGIQKKLNHIIYFQSENLRLTGIMLQPFIPTSAGKLLDALGVAKDRRTWEYCQVGRDETYGVPMVDLSQRENSQLFPRLACVD